MVFQIVGSLAAFERELTIERTRAGLVAARRRGVKPGPKFILAQASEAVKHARKLITADEPVGEAATAVHRGSYERMDEAYRALEEWMTANRRASAGCSWEIYGDRTPDPDNAETTMVHLLK